MEQKLEQYLDELVESLKSANAFVLEELPYFIHEFLTFYFWHHFIWGLFFLSVSAFFVVLVFLQQKWKNEAGCFEKDKWNFMSVWCAISTIPFFCIFIYHMIQIIKVTIAPRVYLIQSLSKFISGGG